MVRSNVVVGSILTGIFVSIRLLLGEVPSVVFVIVVKHGGRIMSIALMGEGAGVLFAESSGILQLHVMCRDLCLMVLNR